MIINVKEGETLESFVARVRRTLPPDVPPSPPGWNELMDRKEADIPQEEKNDGDS